MIRIATAILATATFAACDGPSDSGLVLESDFWVTACGADSTVSLDEEETVDGSPSIEFLSDGQVQGFTCCNSFFGRYTTRDSDSVHLIRITVEGMTLALCPHSDREQEYLEQLRHAKSYVVSSDRLLLMDSTGSLALTFIPASKTQKKQ